LFSQGQIQDFSQDFLGKQILKVNRKKGSSNVGAGGLELLHPSPRSVPGLKKRHQQQGQRYGGGLKSS